MTKKKQYPLTIEKLSKIYLVTTGEYSDYQVKAAFSSKEKAQALIDDYLGEKANDLEEYELDEVTVKPGLHVFAVNLKRNGDLIYCMICSHTVRNCGPDSIIVFEGKRNFMVYIRAETRAKAIKIAGEYRTKLIQENRL